MTYHYWTDQRRTLAFGVKALLYEDMCIGRSVGLMGRVLSGIGWSSAQECVNDIEPISLCLLDRVTFGWAKEDLPLL